jgi:3',5'-cyclic AMP phosphodiesterase CpdA
LDNGLKRALIAAAALLASAAASALPVDVYAAGDIADCRTSAPVRSHAAATARLIPAHATVLMLGDAIYTPPTPANYRVCYQPTWGAHLADTIAVPGNHDYAGGSAQGFLDYFNGASSGRTYFARRLGRWLVIGLDSNLKNEALDEQFRWLDATLAAQHDAGCTLALWHAPLYSSGMHRGSGEHMRRFWKVLDAFGASFVLNGHEHFYEAFEPRDANGRRDPNGMREFVVGTGGAKLHGFWRPPYASRARLERYGVLHLMLDDDSYAWQFLDLRGREADAGRSRCNR